jgi:hypothetical protein
MSTPTTAFDEMVPLKPKPAGASGACAPPLFDPQRIGRRLPRVGYAVHHIATHGTGTDLVRQRQCRMLTAAIRATLIRPGKIAHSQEHRCRGA